MLTFVTYPPVPVRRTFAAVPPTTDETPDEAQDAAQERRLRRVILAAFVALGGALVLSRLTAAFEHESPSVVEAAIPWTTFTAALTTAMQATTTPMVTAAGGDALAQISRAPVFDPAAPAVVDYLAEHTAELVTGVTDETRAAIRQLVQRAIQEGTAPRAAARELQAQIGLTARQDAAVARYRAGLVKAGRKAADVDRLAARYSAQLLRRRAAIIAQTELVNAQAAGQLLGWQQAADAGLLSRERTQRRWVTAATPCVKVCAPMAGQTVAFDAPFRTGDGRSIMAPTAHVSCRCRVQVVIG